MWIPAPFHFRVNTMRDPSLHVKHRSGLDKAGGAEANYVHPGTQRAAIGMPAVPDDRLIPLRPRRIDQGDHVLAQHVEDHMERK